MLRNRVAVEKVPLMSWGCPWAEFLPAAVACGAAIAMAGMGGLLDLLLKTNMIHK